MPRLYVQLEGQPGTSLQIYDKPHDNKIRIQLDIIGGIVETGLNCTIQDLDKLIELLEFGRSLLDENHEIISSNEARAIIDGNKYYSDDKGLTYKRVGENND